MTVVWATRRNVFPSESNAIRRLGFWNLYPNRVYFAVAKRNACEYYRCEYICTFLFFMVETLDEIIVQEPFKRKSPGCLILYTSPAPFTFDGNKTSPNHSFWFSVSYASTIQVSINFYKSRTRFFTHPLTNG